MKKLEVLLLTKDSEWGSLAHEILDSYNCIIECYKGRHGEKMPQLQKRAYDFVVSFSSPWIVPQELLENAKIAAINFHPGPPNYPGIGCTNFAIYNGEKEFGATCHHMNFKVDTGQIIEVVRFPLYETDNVIRLTGRTYTNMFMMYRKILEGFFKDGTFPKSTEKWARKPYTRKELNDLCKVTEDMDRDEIARRIRATKFPGKPGAHYFLLNKFGN